MIGCLSCALPTTLKTFLKNLMWGMLLLNAQNDCKLIPEPMCARLCCASPTEAAWAWTA